VENYRGTGETNSDFSSVGGRIFTPLHGNQRNYPIGSCAFPIADLQLNPDSAVEGETSDEAQAFRCEVNGSVPLRNLQAAV
jgi:hypothetical protein